MTQARATVRQMAFATAALLALVVAGTVGYMVVLDEGLIGAVYTTVIVLSTLGLDHVPKTAASQLLTVGLLVSGVAIYLYVFSSVLELIVGGTITGGWQERRTRRRVQGLTDHYIICGHGRMGAGVAHALRATGVEYVIVEKDEAAVTAARDAGESALHGNGSEDEDLKRAGIDRARGLVACTGSDAENLYIVLTARQLRDDLVIVARASDDDSAKKLSRAGANDTISPFEIAGKEMAAMVVRPHVGEYLDVVLEPEAPPFRLEQIEVPPGSPARGKTIRDLDVHERTGAMVIAHRPKDGSFTARPGPETRLAEGDVVIAVGTGEEVRALEALFEATEAVAR